MAQPFKVLLIDDSELLHAYVKRSLADLGNDLILLVADSVSAGYQHFLAYPRLDLIIVDACVSSNRVNTDRLIRDIRCHGYSGELVAISEHDEQRRCLLEAGCTFEIVHKRDVPEYIRMRCLTRSVN